MEYYNKEKEEVIEEFNSNIEGITTKEAQKRLEQYGKNELPKNLR